MNIVTVRDDLVYTQDMADPTSTTFQDLESQHCAEVSYHFSNLTTYCLAISEGIRPLRIVGKMRVQPL